MVVAEVQGGGQGGARERRFVTQYSQRVCVVHYLSISGVCMWSAEIFPSTKGVPLLMIVSQQV